MDTLALVGTKITEGAKAFLYKEYIWLTIWSCSFAIVLGSTVDLLEMNMHRAPTNFPYTATSYLTGSMTSIIAGYVGMRIAVYTNTRVTFTCCSSVHRGFITAFRGGQVLGFVLVGLAILNIMIIILLFKACWYNEYLKQAVAAGKPINRCPEGDAVHVAAAQNNLWRAFEELTHTQWARAYHAANRFGVYKDTAGAITHCASATDAKCKGALNIIKAQTTFDMFTKSTEYYNAVGHTVMTPKNGNVAAVDWTKATCIGYNQVWGVVDPTSKIGS
jgi:hypothetical protein